EKTVPLYVLHYTSADGPGESTWSVYREWYESPASEEPIEGSQTFVSTHATESEADAEARRLQRLVVQNNNNGGKAMGFFEEESCETCEEAGREYDPDRHDSQNCWADNPVNERIDFTALDAF